MGFFFTSNKNKLSRRDINSALSKISILEGADKQAIKKRLRQRSGGGVTRQDVIDVTRQFKRDLSDTVDSAEADAVKRELLETLDDKQD